MGDGISMYMRDYVKRALIGAPYNSQVIGYSYPQWEVGKGNEAVGMAEFTVKSRCPDYHGVFFRVRRVFREDVVATAEQSVAMTNEFIATVQAAIKPRTPQVGAYFVIMDDTVMTLFEQGRYLVEFRVDKGIHLLIHEKPGTNRYLEIYLGGCFEECVLTPIQ
ncbi:hypothetical protein D3C84_913970 [compost metagenome]